METIKLKDFVQRALVEVAQAVKGANEELKEPNMSNPFWLQYTGGDNPKGRGVEFDVAITASKGGTDASGFMVALATLGGGTKTERSTENELVHRIRFVVGIARNWL